MATAFIMSEIPPVTYCPPMAARGSQPEPQFSKRRWTHANFDADGDVRGSTISFEDFTQGCSINSYNRAVHRPVSIPLWSRDPKKREQVLQRTFELRLFGKMDLEKLDKLPRAKRLSRLTARFQEKVDIETRQLELLCATYIKEKSAPDVDPKRIRTLERKIRSRDTSIRLLMDPFVVFRACFLSFNLGWNSGDVATEIGFDRAHIRRTLMRIREVARDLGFDYESSALRTPQTLHNADGQRVCPCGALLPPYRRFCDACLAVRNPRKPCPDCGGERMPRCKRCADCAEKHYRELKARDPLPAREADGVPLRPPKTGVLRVPQSSHCACGAALTGKKQFCDPCMKARRRQQWREHERKKRLQKNPSQDPVNPEDANA